jgi:hypothetical protein
LLTVSISIVMPASDVRAEQPEVPADSQGDATRIEFHGWSPDSEFVAYTRTKQRRVEDPKKSKPQLTRRSLHRRVKRGRFKGTGPIGDEHIPRLAERKGYVVEQLERLRVDDEETWYIAPEGTYKLRLSVDKSLVWELSFADEVIVRRAFDTPYVDHDVRLYPSPDRRSVLVIMHLSTGWSLHGAVYPLALPRRVKEAYQALTAPQPKP